MSDQATEVRFKGRRFSIRDEMVQVPTHAIFGPGADRDLDWIRLHPRAQGTTQEITEVPLEVWDGRVAPSGTPL